ncbi:hypothetical protein AB0J38_16990 [Streptomyces sp. NPDC050095]|uniref:hypothetical protein n=1 Tax=unclassified Streptomyces TaxID=2593676 RepID=UPI00344467A0
MRHVRLLPRASVRAAAVFALSTGLAASGAVLAPSAAVAATQVTVTAATLDDGRLEIGLPYNTLSVRVNVLASSAPDAATLLTTDAFTYRDYNLWDTDEPVRLPEGTAHGRYPVTVDYRLPDGTTGTWTGGTLDYRPHTGVTKLSFDRATTDYVNRSATLTGHADTFDPATGTTGPAPEGTEVDVNFRLYSDDWRDLKQTAVVGADGSFSLGVTPQAAVVGGTATVRATDASAADQGFGVPELPVAKTSYRISGGLDKKRVHAGDPVQVTGRVERFTDAGWKPFTGAPVVSARSVPDTYDYTYSGRLGSGTADANGVFTYAVRPGYSGTVSTFVQPSVYLAKFPYFQGPVAVPRAFTYTNVKTTLDADGTVTATARMKADYCGDEKVTLQYSADGRSWHTLKNGVAEGGTAGYCPITITTSGFVNAYYRIVHAETDRFLALNTPSVHLKRTLTRFTSFSASPSRPYKNGRFTVSATLQEYWGGKWHGYKGAATLLLFKPKGDPQWYWVKKASTGSYGKISYSLKAEYGDGTWVIVLNPNAQHFYSDTPSKYLDVR